jgi:UDP-glucose 4-epimerase
LAYTAILLVGPIEDLHLDFQLRGEKTGMSSTKKLVEINSALVTGGAGFVGSHLVEKLANSGAQVTVLDNLSSGLRENISNKNVDFVCGDIRDSNLVDSLVQNVDIVFHLAEYIPETKKFGAGHVIKYSVENPLLDFDVSCLGSLTVLDKCRKYDKAIVFTSSAAVYGESGNESISEESQTMPSSPYGASKLCAEVYMVLYSNLYELPVTVLRFCNLYGPRQRKYLMYDILCKLRKNPKRLEILGTGFEQRDFIYVEDAVNAVLLAALSSKSSGSPIFNVGTGTSISIKETVTSMLGILGIAPEVTFSQSSWKGDIKKLSANVNKINQLGFKPEYSLRKGMTKTIEWFGGTEP